MNGTFYNSSVKDVFTIARLKSAAFECSL